MKAEIFLCVISLSASAQIESGTLIVTNASQDEIVVAADSRSYNATTVFDDRCKITALGNQLVFAASGKTAFLSMDSNIAWDSHTVARDIFLRLSRENAMQPLPVRMATAWGGEIKDKLKADLIRDRREVLFGATEPGVLVQGLFVGFDHNSFLTITVKIAYSIAGTGEVTTTATLTEWRGAKALQMGRNEIASELFARQTDRARKWVEGLTTKPGLDSIAVPAIEAVRFSIENYAPVDVGNRMLVPIGGPVDAVKLTQTQGIQWLQRKPNCPEN